MYKVVNGIRIELQPEEQLAVVTEHRAEIANREKRDAAKHVRASKKEELLHKLGLSMDDWKLINGA